MVHYFRKQCEIAFNELLEVCEGLDERGSWRRLTPNEGDYLHSDGSILGQVTHVAGCKVLYASAAFHDMEIRLRDITERTIAIGADWEAAKAYLIEAQQYSLDSWQNSDPSKLDEDVATNWGERWPLWKVLHTIIGHDSYHAGQIALTRTVAPVADGPPPPISEDEITFLKTFPAW